MKAMRHAKERRHESDQRGTDRLLLVKIPHLCGGICGKGLGVHPRRVTSRLAPISIEVD